MSSGLNNTHEENVPSSFPLWSPDTCSASATLLEAFRVKASAQSSTSLGDYDRLHAWSIADRLGFWNLVWDFCGVRGHKAREVLVNGQTILKAEFFQGAMMNYAENLLRDDMPDEAIVFLGEDGATRRVSRDELRENVSKIRQFLVASGVRQGDRIAGVLPNSPDTVALMLAVTSLGGVWASCSPDFGAQGILDRFSQIDPVILVACDGYLYNGKIHSLEGKISEVVAKLPSVRQTIIVNFLRDRSNPSQVVPENWTRLSTILRQFRAEPLVYDRYPFSSPLFILFSSGTTGSPKCIVHSAGGTLLQHLKEHQLHCDIRKGDRVFYFTTCAWMMWNWLASTLASGATLVLYDGSPFHPDGSRLLDYARDEGVTHFGVSAKYIETVRRSGMLPAKTHQFPEMRVLMSTGSPLSVDNFEFVYSHFKPDVQLVSMSGGTDIISCFVLGVPSRSVWRGEIQGPGLGMAVEVWDESGKRIFGEKGELVCTKAFPSMPLGFWNDQNNTKYREAYFSRYENVWCQGDLAEETEHGGFIIHGRSDTVLNPGGVRIGTAEIYAQLDNVSQVVDAICVGQQFDGDVRVLLFVRLSEGTSLDEVLVKAIKNAIRQGATPRHVPAKIIAVPDIPRTKTGKLAEVAVRDTVHGRLVRNLETLANPDSLAAFKDLAELSL